MVINELQKYNFKATLLHKETKQKLMINGLRKYNFKATLFQEETKQKLMIDRFTRDSISKLCYKMIERDKNTISKLRYYTKQKLIIGRSQVDM